MAVRIGALTAWTAPIPGTPGPTDEPSALAQVASATWTKLGENGSIDYEESGVTISLGRTIEQVFGAGSILPVLTYVSGSEFAIRLRCRDLRYEAFAAAFGVAELTHVGGAAKDAKVTGFDFSNLSILRSRMLLLRGIVNGGMVGATTGNPRDILSPYDGTLAIQYWFPNVVPNITDDEIQYGADTPPAIPVEFTVNAGATAYSTANGDKRFGSLQIQKTA